VLNYKRNRELVYAQQALAQQLQQQGGVEMDSLVSGVKKFIKDYGKRTDILTYMELRCSNCSYMLRTSMILKEVVKELNDKYKALLKQMLRETKSRREK
jgi:outer membrane protein